MNRLALSAAVLLTLTACTPKLPIETDPQRVTYTSAKVREAAREASMMTVRTLIKPDPNASAVQEVAGVPCVIEGTGFKAQIISPAQVLMPTFTGAADNVEVVCENSAIKGTKVVKPFNETLRKINASSSGQTTLLGAIVVSAITAAQKVRRDISKDTFKYPGSVNVTGTSK